MKLSNIFLSAIALGSLASCSGFLDDMPDTRVELKNTEHARLLMNAAYPRANYGWIGEVMSDNLLDNNAPDPDNNNIRYNLNAYDRGDEEMYRWEVNKSNTDSDSPSSVWQNYWLSIAAANECIQLLEKLQAEQGGQMSDDQKAIYGEALVLRAYCHFTLAQIFCMPYRGPELSKNELGLPYMEKPETMVKPHYDRGDMQTLYEKIEADMLKGLPLINNSIFEQPKYHFNKSAAAAFAVRYYQITRNYPKVLEYANLAFGGAEVDASLYVSDIWNVEVFEAIDLNEYSQGITTQRNLMLLATNSAACRRIAGNRFGLIRDALNSTMHSSGPTWTRSRWLSSNGSGSTFYANPCFINNGNVYYRGKQEYGFFFPGNCYERFEYTDKVAGIGYAHITRSEFTGEEVLLARAEAKLFLGDRSGALADLHIIENSWRNCQTAKANPDLLDEWTESRVIDFYSQAPGTGSLVPASIVKEIHIDEVCPSAEYHVTADILPVLQCVQHFRRITMVHTGDRWFEIKRLGLEYDHPYGRDLNYHLDVLDQRKAGQIPSEVVSAGFQENPRATEEAKIAPASVRVK
ncbi:MAG: RagB/SusD family nutrient uptake outer membrane protein [Muribaculaceae bacterium]|nr:RagB/SusD family nutrient uptake outer membrane protein [Muribaculaceae bacterium]